MFSYLENTCKSIQIRLKDSITLKNAIKILLLLFFLFLHLSFLSVNYKNQKNRFDETHYEAPLSITIFDFASKSGSKLVLSWDQFRQNQTTILDPNLMGLQSRFPKIRGTIKMISFSWVG